VNFRLDFMSEAGRHARVSSMLTRDRYEYFIIMCCNLCLHPSVKNRLDSPEGLSFNEFAYQLFQAYDFYQLHVNEGCTVQLGGSDQWGNITAGMDLIRRKLGSSVSVDVFGLTIPLVTSSTGEKFGKSAGNAVWLDADELSPLEFYQFFRRSPDSEVEKYLHFFTFLPSEAIRALMEEHNKYPERHAPQRSLAYEVTEIVHGGR
jgi:tyrosyl-tRNA synthetase